MQLPTYDDFSKYQFIDVLDALSLRLMVIDHAQKYCMSRNKISSKDNSATGAASVKNQVDSLELSSEEEEEGQDFRNTEEQQEEIKNIIAADRKRLMTK